MGNRKREFVIKDLMVPKFMVQEGREVLLAERISFNHIPIKMERDNGGILTGRLNT